MDWSPKCQPWPETLGHQDAVKQMRTHHTWWGCMDATSIWIQVKYWVVLAGQRNHNKKLCSYTTETPGKHEIGSAPIKNNWYMGTVFKASYVSKPFQLESCKDFFWQPAVGGTSFPQWSESSPGMLEAARSVGRYQVKVGPSLCSKCPPKSWPSLPSLLWLPSQYAAKTELAEMRKRKKLGDWGASTYAMYVDIQSWLKYGFWATVAILQLQWL